MIKELLLSLAIVLSGGFLYSCYHFFKQKWLMRRFRGPLALPIIGNAYDRNALYFLRYLSTQRNQYGKLFSIFTMFSGFLVVCDPIVVRRILSDNKAFYKGQDYSDRFSYCCGEGLVSSNHAKHNHDRALFGRYFSRTSVSHFVGKIRDLTTLCQHDLIDSKLDKTGSLKINVEHFFAVLALRCLMQLLASTDLSGERDLEERLLDAVSRGSNAMGSVIIFGLPMWPFLPQMKILDQLNSTLARVFRKILSHRRERVAMGLDADKDDCLAAMLREKMDESEMVEHFSTFVAAGHDTTSFFLSYLTYVLATHQDVQDKLYAHICEKLQNKGLEDPISAEDFGQMRYLHLVMMETLRYYAIIPCVTRVASEDVHIKEANVTLPKGINLLCPMVVLNRDPEIWDKPSEFIPERFAERGNDFTSARDGYFPFGYGSRTCIGNLFAQIEAGIVLTMMMRKYRFDPEPGFRPIIVAGISLTTSNGVKIILRRR